MEAFGDLAKNTTQFHPATTATSITNDIVQAKSQQNEGRREKLQGGI